MLKESSSAALIQLSGALRKHLPQVSEKRRFGVHVSTRCAPHGLGQLPFRVKLLRDAAVVRRCEWITRRSQRLSNFIAGAGFQDVFCARNRSAGNCAAVEQNHRLVGGEACCGRRGVFLSSRDQAAPNLALLVKIPLYCYGVTSCRPVCPTFAWWLRVGHQRQRCAQACMDQVAGSPSCPCFADCTARSSCAVRPTGACSRGMLPRSRGVSASAAVSCWVAPRWAQGRRFGREGARDALSGPMITTAMCDALAGALCRR